MVEWGSVSEQATLDRYIRGEGVSTAEFARVWKKLSAGNIGDLVSEKSIYTDFFAVVRDVNSRLPPADRIRVFGGDASSTDRDATAVSILKKEALQKGGKALIVYGGAHFWRSVPGMGGMSRMLDAAYPGRTLVVLPIGGPGENVAAYPKFDRVLKTQLRPVLIPAQRLPFKDFTAEESVGGQVCRVTRGGCRSIFEGSTLTIGKMADAFVYFGKPQ